jgi:predicted nucleotidyltransferase
MESYISELWQSLKNIANLLKDRDINFTIIGGAARNQYGVKKITEDVDILVAKKDKEKMLKLPIGFIKDLSKGRGKIFSFHNPKTRVEIIYSGEISGDGINGIAYENPKLISNDIKGIPFLTLEKLIEYKLSSGIYGKRMKDFVDIIELIQINKLPEDYAKNFRKDLYIKYKELWKSSKEEKTL